MVWQDAVIATAQIFFIVALIPSLITSSKPALATSAMNMMLVWIVAVAQFTLHLWFSTITAFAIGVGHLTLAIQKYRIDRAEQE